MIMKKNFGHPQVLYVYFRFYSIKKTKEFLLNLQGWTYHLSTIISTWILTGSLLIYMFTLIIDFRHIKVISPKIFLTDDIIDDQD